MIVLQELATAQEFKIIPRELEADSMVITNELTDVSTTYAITPTIDRYYLVINKIVNLQQNNFYTLSVLNNTDVVYKGKIFCTNQTIPTYTPNNNEYTTYPSNNDYITYE
jgi:hypothetical protein